MRTTVKQLNYQGNEEVLDAKKYTEQIICYQCGSIRYVKKADYKQVKKAGLCKACIYISRKLRALDKKI